MAPSSLQSFMAAIASSVACSRRERERESERERERKTRERERESEREKEREKNKRERERERVRERKRDRERERAIEQREAWSMCHTEPRLVPRRLWSLLCSAGSPSKGPPA